MTFFDLVIACFLTRAHLIPSSDGYCNLLYELL